MHDEHRLDNIFALHFVELPAIKVPKQLQMANPALQRWARFLGAASDSDLAKVAEEDEMIAEAYDVLRELSNDRDTRIAARKRLDELKLYALDMRAEREQGRVEGREEGSAKTFASNILSLLENKGIDITSDARKRIEECRDIDRLKAWFNRAMRLNPADMLDTLFSQ